MELAQNTGGGTILSRIEQFSSRMGRSLYGAMPFIRKADSERERVRQCHRKEMGTVSADAGGKITPRAPRWGYLQWGLKLLMVVAMVSRVKGMQEHTLIDAVGTIKLEAVRQPTNKQAKDILKRAIVLAGVGPNGNKWISKIGACTEGPITMITMDMDSIMDMGTTREITNQCFSFNINLSIRLQSEFTEIEQKLETEYKKFSNDLQGLDGKSRVAWGRNVKKMTFSLGVALDSKLQKLVDDVRASQGQRDVEDGMAGYEREVRRQENERIASLAGQPPKGRLQRFLEDADTETTDGSLSPMTKLNDFLSADSPDGPTVTGTPPKDTKLKLSGR